MKKQNLIIYIIPIIIILVYWLTSQVTELEITVERKPVVLAGSRKVTEPRQKMRIIEGQILPHKGFIQALLAMEGIKMPLALKISNILKEEVDFRYIVAGEELRLMVSEPDGKIIQFEYQPDPVTVHRLVAKNFTNLYGNINQDYDFDYEIIEFPTENKIRVIEGFIETTLNQALIDYDLQSGDRAVVNNVLNCLVSFRTDARKYDRFKILLKERFYEGKRLSGSEILYASYNGRISGFKEAFAFFDEEKSAFNAHYSPKGKALIASSLRLPLDRIHVTSSFGYRIHPITGRRKFHNGVDYRGSVGTPVYAVAKGKVVQSTRTNLGGNQIAIRHSDGTTSYYLHLNKRYARKGQYIRPRQKIGSVGRTGRVSGPHLHFGLKRKGKWVNPLRVRMIATPQLEGERFERFKEQAVDIKGLREKVEELQLIDS